MSVAVFLVLAVIAVILMVSRRAMLKGELGGSKVGRTVSALLLCIMWVTYITVSTLAQYELWPFNS